MKRSQMVVLVDVVWTLDPPRTSVRDGMLTLMKESVLSRSGIKIGNRVTYLLKAPAKSRAPTMVFSLGRPLIAFRPVLFAIKKPPPIWVKDGNEMLDRSGLSTKARVPPV